MDADAVIVATGGLSYPSTGSTGDGYKMAEDAGHTVTECTPSLVPFNVKEEWVKSLQGLSLKNTAISIYSGKKKLYEDFGEMLFTHFGVSGPMILSASASIKQSLIKQPLDMYIDLKPALTQEALDKRLLREFEEAKNKQFKNSINKLLPAKMIPVIIELSGIDPDKKVNEISKEERNRLLMLFKKLPVTLNGPRGYNEAIITKGRHKGEGNQSIHYGVEACEWPLLCRRGAGSGCIYGRLQSADSMVHRISGRNKCSGLMILKTILRHL